ncbi:uncharacterized protein DFL_006586 [Arthrobotrys flagrans]|uniref:Uncharacterized protein n=1 Tax=Arthrobotrys flagrans TaxID=97331 RepID=A0A436ZTI5_ARTFL|nr:hypothetical protein DFL_006586 [Arthrobotrys flagrans]
MSIRAHTYAQPPPRSNHIELSRVTPATLHSRSYVIWFDRDGKCSTLDADQTRVFIYDRNTLVPPGCIYYMILSEDPTLEDYRLLKSRFSCPSELDRRFHTFNNSISHPRWKAGQLSEIGTSNRIDFYVQYNNPTRLSKFIDDFKGSSIGWLSRLKGYFLASSYPLVEKFEKNEERESKTLAKGEDPTAGGKIQLWTMRGLTLFPYLDRAQLSKRLWRKGVGNANDGANLWYSKHSISLCRISDTEDGRISADLYIFDQFGDWTVSPILWENDKLHRVIVGDFAKPCLSFRTVFQELIVSSTSATRLCWDQRGIMNLKDHQIAKIIRMACLLDLLRLIAAQLMRYIDDLNFQATKEDLALYDKDHERNSSHLYQLEAVLSNISHYASYLKKKLRPHQDFSSSSSSTAPTISQIKGIRLRRLLSNLESEIEGMMSTVVSIRALQENGYQSRSDTRQRQESLHIRKLAILATIFLPLSLAAGLLSMQTRVSELGNLLYDYVGVVVTLAWILMFYFAFDVSRMKGTALMLFPYPKAVFFTGLCVTMMSFQFGMWWEVRRGWMSLGLGIAPVGVMVLLVWLITRFMTGGT